MKLTKSLSYGKFFLFFPLIISIVLCMRCSMEHRIDDETRLKEGEAKVKLHVMVPNLNPAPLASRASEISNMMVMTFETTSGFFYMKDTPQPCIIEFADTPDESYYVATLNATTDPRLVVIVANASAALLSYTYTVDVTTLADVELFKTQALTTAVIGGTTYITQQPEIACMEGRVTLPSIQNGMIITDSSNPVPLTRGTAQIVVDSSPVPATDLEILGASLCNAPLRGFIFPQPTIATSSEAHYHYTSSSTSFLPFVGAASTQKSEPLYCYEDSKDNGLFVLLEANYKGVHGYYRINMVDGVLSDFDYDRNPIDIVRNTLYTVNIYKASNYGYTTIAEAINNRASNIEYIVTAYVPSTEQYEDAHDIIFNGDYFLGVSNSAFVSYSSGSTSVIATTVTHSATATVTTASVSVSGTGLTLITPSTGTFNPGDVNKKFNITVSMSTGFATGTITIVLGNITKVITVEQRAPVPFVAGVVDDFAIGNEHFTGMLIPVGGVTPDWLKFSSAADGSNAVEEIANLAGKIYVVHDHNIVKNGGAIRSGSVYITRDDEKGRVKALFYQNFLNTDGITDNTPATVNTYVGAFWKANQTGERLIRILRPTTSSVIDGRWTAIVLEGDSWIKLDKMMPSDPGVWTTAGPSMDGNDSGFDALYSVVGTATSVFGRMTASAPNDEIYFRIGLRNTYMPTILAPARYGIVLLASAEGSVLQRIWIRQGEEPDYVMRPGDKDGSNNSVGGVEDRQYAKQWSPYNLTAGTLNAQVDIPGTTPPVNPGLFTNYPSQGGAVFFWASTINTRFAYNPLNLGASVSAASGFWSTLGAINEACPPGYRRPNDGTISAFNSSGLVSESEFRQSLWLDPPVLNANSFTNTTWGYYADGFFDRREIVSSLTNVASSTVSYYASNPSDPRNKDVAYIGRLFFNPINHASLFIPAAGFGGNLSNDEMGAMGHYWSSTRVNSSFAFAFVGRRDEARLQSNSNVGASGSLSIRCIFGETPTLSVDPTSQLFLYNESSSSVEKSFTITTNQSSWLWSATYTNCLASDFTITPVGNELRIYPNSNNGSSSTERRVTITITAGSATPVDVYVIHDYNPGGGGTVPFTDQSFVGAFWRHNQTGERLIRINNIPSGSEGAWSASVAWMDSQWSAGSIVLDDNLIDDPSLALRNIDFSTVIPDASISSAESYQLSGTAQSVSGFVAVGGTIMFRIGLKNSFLAYDEVTSPARYAVVMLIFNNGAKSQRLFLRQGEGADNVSTVAGYNTVKWSPYNVGNYSTPMQYGFDRLVDYPTKAGYFYQLGYSTTLSTPVGYTPQDPISPSWIPVIPSPIRALDDACPPDYRPPTGTASGEQQSVIVSTGSGIENVVGYYADGFFDRRKIEVATGYDINTPIPSAVSNNTNNVAYVGSLLYNPATNASLFFPMNGYRFGGTLTFMRTGSYWSNTIQPGGTGAYILFLNNGYFSLSSTYGASAVGMAVRCINTPIDPDNIRITTFVNVMYDFQHQTLEAYVTGGPAPTAWQWKVSTSRNGTYTDIPGANSATYTVPANFIYNSAYNGATNDELFFKCELSNATGSALTLDANALGIEFIRTNTSGYSIRNGIRYLTLQRASHLGSGPAFINLALLDLGASGTGAYTNGGLTHIPDDGVANDAADLGDLYQWGRIADGHEHIVWTKDPTTHANTILPMTGGSGATSLNVPRNAGAQFYTTNGQIDPTNTGYYGNYIANLGDWGTQAAGNNDLWGNGLDSRSGVPINVFQWSTKAQANNPCPADWHIPSKYDFWDMYRGDGYDLAGSGTSPWWGSFNNNWRPRNVQTNTDACGGAIITNAFGEKLFLPLVGQRSGSAGNFTYNPSSTYASFWSSNAYVVSALYSTATVLQFHPSVNVSADANPNRANGGLIRCMIAEQ